MSEPKSVKELLELGERVLADSSARFEDHDDLYEARQLLASALRITDDEAEDLPDDLEPPLRLRERYLSYIARRADGEPQPFIRGKIEFFGLELKVRPGAFVPRPSSELTVERAVKKLKGRKHPIVVDVATGAGPIALAIADEVPSADVWGTDIQEEGLKMGRENARGLGIKNVTLKRGDMYGALPDRLKGKVDVITGHVPYVPLGELDDLPSEVKDHEPVFTLTDHSDDGLSLIKHAIDGSVDLLKPGGWLLLEMSDDTAPLIKKSVKRAGLEDYHVATDDDGLSVVVEARMPGSRRGSR
ncbi:MAG: release factor glutamine methyltransferase [Actinomycetota bacterium]|jgi:release factor glutamine methyltransferase|nr:release factor glutamine methyltransferase [Actinomycetota bacterium]